MCECVCARVCMCVHAWHRQQGEHSTEKHHVCTVHHTAVVSGVCTRLLSARGRVLAIRGNGNGRRRSLCYCNRHLSHARVVSLSCGWVECFVGCGSGSGFECCKPAWTDTDLAVHPLQTLRANDQTHVGRSIHHPTQRTAAETECTAREWRAHTMTTRRRCMLIRDLC